MRGSCAARSRSARSCARPSPSRLAPSGVIGVLEFVSRSRRRPDREQLDLLGVVGRQVGQYVGRWRAERRLRAVEERAGAVMRAALDYIVSMDASGVVVDFNPAAEQTFGYTRAEAGGAELADLIIPPELRDAHRTALQRHRSDRRAVRRR